MPAVKKATRSSKTKVISGGKKSVAPVQLRLFTVIAIVVVALGGFVGWSVWHSSNASAASCAKATYKQGSSGTCVKYIQTLANYFIPTPKGNAKADLKVDGAFGAKTTTAIKDIQKIFGLKVDGIVGKQTWNIICSQQMGPGINPAYPRSTAIKAGCPNY